MPNDAKLGLVVGVSLVILLAVLFFRRDLIPQQASPGANQPAASRPPGTILPAAPRGQFRATQAQPVIDTDEVADEAANLRYHTVQDGETLFTLAQHYYGDGDKFNEIYRVNKKRLKTPDGLTPGMKLVIPELN